MSRILITFSFLLLLICFGYGYQMYDNLPEQVPSHFNAHGQADAWEAKKSFFILFYAIILFVNILFNAIALVIDKIPPSLINVPWKEYWFANEERKKIIYGRLKGILGAAGIFANATFLLCLQMVIQKSMTEPPATIQIPFSLIMFSIAAMAIFFVVWIFTIARPNKQD